MLSTDMQRAAVTLSPEDDLQVETNRFRVDVKPD